MTAAYALIFFVFGALFVWLGGPFGSMPEFGMTSIVGVMLFALAGALFTTRHSRSYRITLNRPGFLSLSLIALSAVVLLVLAVVLQRHGPSAAVYVLMGKTPPDSILNGAYREKLPLRALVPPLVVAMLLCAWLLATLRRRILLPLGVTGLAVAFTGIFETRHVMVWAILYFLLLKYLYMQQFIAHLRSMGLRRLLIPAAMLIFCFSVFVAFGNARSGLTSADSERFAEAMALEPPYTQLPMNGVWVVIYGFGGFARGIANAPYVPVVTFNPPEKILPGPMQFLVTSGHINLPGFGSTRFSAQGYALDAWHTYGLYFGLIGAVVFFALFFLIYYLMVRSLERRLARGQGFSSLATAFLLWLSMRLALLPVGDYVCDFAALMELTFLLGLFWIAQIRIEPQSDAAAKTAAHGAAAA
ncbi:MAG TPA: hypothetical protein VEK08_05760 [Planctomycetota bacterium]|nr:hypothetical protein [Planctomycetota bacterium]